MMKIKFLGAAREVGRSAFLVDSGDKVLLDYGVKLTTGLTEYPLPVETNLNAAVISHAHLDHSGNLPHLFLKSNIPTYITPSTLELSKMLWHDTLKIAGFEGLTAPFTKEEIARTSKYSFELNYNRELNLTDDTSLEFYDAGHIMGAAMTRLNTGKKSLVYTGDFKLEETRLHKGADKKALRKCDYMLIESTYGDREHGNRKEIEKEFVETVQDTLDRGGHVLIPAFALGRSQEVIDILHEYKIGSNIFLDGMGQKAARIMLKYPKLMKNPGMLKKALDKVKWVRNMAMRKNALKEPSIIVTTAGMLQGGPVLAYLPELYKDKNSSLLMTGYQVEGTPGEILLNTGKINLHGINVDVKMQVKKFDFSAHASQSELIRTVEKANPEKVICVHGDDKVITKFIRELKGNGFDAVGPKLGQELTLK